MGKHSFKDDPLSAPGSLSADAARRILAGPVRTTIVRHDNELWSMPSQPKNLTRDGKHGWILHYDAVFTKAIEITARSWHICARKIGSAYDMAVTRHRNTL